MGEINILGGCTHHGNEFLKLPGKICPVHKHFPVHCQQLILYQAEQNNGITTICWYEQVPWEHTEIHPGGSYDANKAQKKGGKA